MVPDFCIVLDIKYITRCGTCRFYILLAIDEHERDVVKIVMLSSNFLSEMKKKMPSEMSDEIIG